MQTNQAVYATSGIDAEHVESKRKHEDLTQLFEGGLHLLPRHRPWEVLDANAKTSEATTQARLSDETQQSAQTASIPSENTCFDQKALANTTKCP